MVQSFKTEIALFLKEFFGGYYPDYVRKNKISPEIPVFTYHRIHPLTFEDHLKYLRKNNYRTVTADELLQLSISINENPKKERIVALTFDDGLNDIYTIAYPLLKKYHFHAIAFILPGRMGQPGMITWKQAAEMHASGTFDFQSHSFSHTAIPVSNKIVNFFNPALLNKKPWRIPFPFNDDDGVNFTPQAYGLPIFQSDSPFSDHPQFVPNRKGIQQCITYVKEHGDSRFFKKIRWKSKLMKVAQQAGAAQGEFETREQQIARMKQELSESKTQIEAHFPDKQVFHFAWPWDMPGVLAVHLLVECGYKAAFMGLSGGNFLNQKINNLCLIRRTHGDFLKCLPGKGRQSFYQILLNKLAERIRWGNPY
jgi:hypothetical protein